MHCLRIISHPDLTLLYGELQLHAAFCHPGKRREARCGQRYHGQVSEALESLADLAPPHIDAVAPIGIHESPSRASAGPADPFFIGLAHIDPDPDRAREVLLPERGLILVSDAVTEDQRLISVQGKGQKPYHHALVVLGWMAGDGQAVVVIVAALRIGYLQLCFEYGRFERHEVIFLKWSLSFDPLKIHMRVL